MWKRIAVIATERGISTKTVRRRLDLMRASKAYKEGSDYRKDGRTVTINEASYERLRREINEGKILITK